MYRSRLDRSARPQRRACLCGCAGLNPRSKKGTLHVTGRGVCFWFVFFFFLASLQTHSPTSRVSEHAHPRLLSVAASMQCKDSHAEGTSVSARARRRFCLRLRGWAAERIELTGQSAIRGEFVLDHKDVKTGKHYPITPSDHYGILLQLRPRAEPAGALAAVAPASGAAFLRDRGRLRG